MENKNYDVFISFKSNDLELAKDVHDFLVAKGYTVFFSESTLRKEGPSDYYQKIHEAIKGSRHMIVVCSDAKFVISSDDKNSSKWVFNEWTFFDKLRLSGEKPHGALVTIYKDVNVKDLPIKLQDACIPYADYKASILNYLKNKKEEEPDHVSDPAPDLKKPSLIERSINFIKKVFTKRLVTPLLAALLGLLLGSSLFFCGRNQDKSNEAVVSTDSVETRTLLFAGGGSVATYLNKNYSDRVREYFSKHFNTLKDYSKDSIFSRNYYPNSIYLHMPSGPALSLLVEEAFMPDTQKGQPFYPVCFSAMRASESTFTTTCTADQIKKVGIVLEYYIGDEHLTVYLEKNDKIEKIAKLSTFINKDSITVEKLRDLLSKDYYTVYSTTHESGTYKAYVKTIGDIKKYKLDSTQYYSCETDSDLFEKTNKPFMILGGECYYPKNYAEHINRDEINVLTLYDENENCRVPNPLYLYFMAYKDGSRYKVSKEIIDLLTILGFKDDAKHPRFTKDTNERFYYVYIDKADSLIQPINKRN